MLKKTVSKKFLYISIALLFAFALIGRSISTANVAPFRAFGGAVWLKDGVHYINDNQITTRAEQMNAPAELKLTNDILLVTPSCDAVESGFCQQGSGVYVDKALVSSAVAYVPAVPDTKKVVGYCTACNDGTWSPSCAVGRGACSWHSGVAAYNVAQYVTIKGTPAVAAEPAVYSYSPKTYKDSSAYIEPVTPNLDEIVKFAN